jgi:ATP-binding protein involved in chromosome partitioning
VKPIRIGCSGWNYDHWRNGVFYPPRLPPRRWLEHYAQHFDTVEVNSTFYRLPRETAVSNWVRETPPEFLLALKMSRYVTHIKRLRDLRPSIDLFYSRIRPLVDSPKLGPVLWQLPPGFRRDDARLAEALDLLPSGRHAFEFRDESWFTEDVYDLLRRHGVALVIGDTPQRPLPGARADGRLDVRPLSPRQPRAPIELLGARARAVGTAVRALGATRRGLCVLQQRPERLRGAQRPVAPPQARRLGTLRSEMEPAREEILKALEQVIDPELKRNVVELDMVRDVRVDGGAVTVGIALTVAGCPLRASFEEQVATALAPVAGVERVSLEFGVMTPEERSALTSRLRGSVTERTKGIRLDRSTRVIAVASGKGGVGKSSLAANLAAAFAQLGQRTGILDADVYGHSIPHLLGIRQKPVVVDRMIVPPVRGELKLMSIGFFLDANEPVMWRGPMLHRALEQFLTDVHWGELDTLVVDMPPGTGDVSISLGQLLPRAEAVIVTTPQPLAQEVAARAALMARKTNMRLLGVVENMSGETFGTGGGDRLAEELEVPLLGRVPLDSRLREAGDSGTPLVESDPGSEPARAIFDVAEAITASRREQGVGIVKALPVLS